MAAQAVDEDPILVIDDSREAAMLPALLPD